MRQLLEGVSVHDALIESVRWRPLVKELRLALVGGISETGYHSIYLTYKGAMLGFARINSLRNAASNREACVLYQEVDVDADGTFVHRLLFWPNDEVTIDFTELEYLCEPRDDCRVALGGAFVIDNDEPDDIDSRRDSMASGTIGQSCR
jgi:hypothetical protein